LSGSVQQKLGDEPLVIARFVEEMLSTPELYQRRGVPFVAPPDPPPPEEVPVEVTLLLPSGATLFGDESVTSTDGAYRLVYQLDGNLVLYAVNGGPLWASDTSGESVGQASMQGDGNLVVYDADGAPRFATGTDGNPGAALFIDAEGTLSIVSADDETLWTMGGTP
jgi:hypothetical protein